MAAATGWAATLALGQIVSVGARGIDDPLRLCAEGGPLHARIEARQACGTPGIPITVGNGHCVAAVKDGAAVTLWLDGQAGASAAVPPTIPTVSRMMGLGPL